MHWTAEQRRRQKSSARDCRLMSEEPPAHSIDLSFSVPMVHRLRVTQEIGGDDFPVLLDLLQHEQTGPSKVLVVAEDVLHAPADRIVSQLRHSDSIEVTGKTVLVSGGEEIKNATTTVEELLRHIHLANLDRRSYIVAIGGGAMLDAVGYAAATAHRGIRLIRLPTTTLAQADSGVGVKNAINYFDKKNWIGTFAVPWAVINDASLLTSLSDRDFRNGFSEAVKVALLKDASGFDWLCENAEAINRREMPIATSAIHRSCMLHLEHITRGGDPFEMLEARPLDFGHWSAHRLEPLTEYQIRHGEAVATGVAIDCLYSTAAFGFPESAAKRVCDCLTALGMPLWHDCLEQVDRLLEGLEEFRQHLGGRLTITMLRDIGDPINVHEIDQDLMKESIEKLGAMYRG